MWVEADRLDVVGSDRRADQTVRRAALALDGAITRRGRRARKFKSLPGAIEQTIERLDVHS